MTSSEERASVDRGLSDRRGLFLAVGGCAVAAAILLLAAGQPWLLATLPAQPPLPAVQKTFRGGEVVEFLVPVGILAGAAGLALIATRRIGRLVVGCGLTAAGFLVMLASGFFLYDDGVNTALAWAQAYAPPGGSLVPDRDVSTVPAGLAAAAGGLALVVGLLASLLSGRWPVMGARYERRTRSSGRAVGRRASVAGVRPAGGASPGADEAAMWSAVERGEDPTMPQSDADPDDGRATTRDQPVPGG